MMLLDVTVNYVVIMLDGSWEMKEFVVCVIAIIENRYSDNPTTKDTVYNGHISNNVSNVHLPTTDLYFAMRTVSALYRFYCVLTTTFVLIQVLLCTDGHIRTYTGSVVY